MNCEKNRAQNPLKLHKLTPCQALLKRVAASPTGRKITRDAVDAEPG